MEYPQLDIEAYSYINDGCDAQYLLFMIPEIHDDVIKKNRDVHTLYPLSTHASYSTTQYSSHLMQQ